MATCRAGDVTAGIYSRHGHGTRCRRRQGGQQAAVPRRPRNFCFLLLQVSSTGLPNAGSRPNMAKDNPRRRGRALGAAPPPAPKPPRRGRAGLGQLHGLTKLRLTQNIARELTLPPSRYSEETPFFELSYGFNFLPSPSCYSLSLLLEMASDLNFCWV